ncbi:MAG: cell envelope integrity protein TolA, partial [Aeromonas sp.]
EAEEKAKAAEAKAKKAEADKKAKAEAEKKAKAEAEKKAKAEAEKKAKADAEKKAKAEADKQAKIAAERKRKAAEQAKLQKEMEEMEEMMQQQLSAEANARSQAASAAAQGEVDKYAALIKATITRYMILDPTMRGKTCKIGVKLASTGFVISVDSGQGDPAVCRSGKAAVLKANQLPVPKDPAVFEQMKELSVTLAPEV